jgi:hypothetical protein
MYVYQTYKAMYLYKTHLQLYLCCNVYKTSSSQKLGLARNPRAWARIKAARRPARGPEQEAPLSQDEARGGRGGPGGPWPGRQSLSATERERRGKWR